MTSKDFKFSRIKNYNDIEFDPENIYKNQLQLSEECRQIKETLLTNFKSNLKEYFQRIELEKEISALNKKQATVSHKLTDLLKKLQIMKEEKECKNLDKNLHLYEENLAFKIKDARNLTKKGEVYRSFDFSNIIESNPQETCSVVLKITEENNHEIYKAIKCHPEITGIEELISRLNKTNDLHTFVIDIRKKIQQSFTKTV